MTMTTSDWIAIGSAAAQIVTTVLVAMFSANKARHAPTAAPATKISAIKWYWRNTAGLWASLFISVSFMVYWFVSERGPVTSSFVFIALLCYSAIAFNAFTLTAFAVAAVMREPFNALHNASTAIAQRHALQAANTRDDPTT